MCKEVGERGIVEGLCESLRGEIRDLGETIFGNEN